MKKWMALLLALVMVFCLVACGEKTVVEEPQQVTPAPEEGASNMVGLSNPWTELGSLEELNETIGGKLSRPATMGVQDQYFGILNENEMAEYQFSLNGTDYSFRFAPATTEDISGVWTDKGTAFSPENQENIQHIDDLELVTIADMKLARWMNIDGQYVLSVCDDGKMDEATFVAIAGELMTMTMDDMLNANGENG